MEDYSDITGQDPEILGMGGYCFIVASILRDLHPAAEIYRLREVDFDTFNHVYLKIDGVPLDIKGFRSIQDMMADVRDNSLLEKKTDQNEVERYFYRITDREERAVARAVLKDHISKNEEKYKGA